MISDGYLRHKLFERALNSLGKGFDLTSDFRLKYAKGNQRLVSINEDQKMEQLTVPGFGTFSDVSPDIKCDKGDRSRYHSDILDFNQMSELINQKCSVTGRFPSGLFNSLFKFESGSWAKDAAKTKYLGFDCHSTVLYDVHIDRYPLKLIQDVSDSVPSTWNPPALSRFIEKYGTHIIVGLSIGGLDMVLVKQDKSSKLGPVELQKHLNEVGKQLFTGVCSFTPRSANSKSQKLKVSASPTLDIFDVPSVSEGSSIVSSKDGITVIRTRRGGNPLSASHCEWLPTVPSRPDAVHFSFIPITSLLKNVPGKGFLSHAINLYLRHKPPLEDLAYFLDFQTHTAWAPACGDLPLAPDTNVPLLKSVLQVGMMGPKLYVNTTQVDVQKRPVTGMRLHLEGMKGNRLSIHLQHLSNMPAMYDDRIIEELPSSLWLGSDEIPEHDRYIEPIQKQKVSCICTVPITSFDNPAPSISTTDHTSTFIVTGAKLHAKKHGSKSILHLSLLFTKVTDLYVVKSNWIRGSTELISSSLKSSLLSMTGISGSLEKEQQQPNNQQAAHVVDSSIYPDGPPVTVQDEKLLRFVDTSQVCQGPQDSPGYWLVTGGKLGLDRGKICLNVQFSLLNAC